MGEDTVITWVYNQHADYNKADESKQTKKGKKLIFSLSLAKKYKKNKIIANNYGQKLQIN